MIRAAFLAVLPALLAAQQPGTPGPFPFPFPFENQPRTFQRGAAREQAPVNPEDACTVAGQVTNAVTGEPLSKATVMLRPAGAFGPGGGPRAYTATTDSAGAFLITGIAPGRYRFAARRTGFVNAGFGSRGDLGPAAEITLAAKARLSDVRLSLTPHAVLTGRITDEDGEPLEFVQVQAMRFRYSAAGKQLAPYGRAVTNDIGEYRLSGLPPGRYYVAASAGGGRWMQASGPEPEEGYVPSYYPGTFDPDAAVPVSVGPGEVLGNVNLRLARRSTYTVRGRVTPVPDAAGRARLMVLLRARGLAVAQMNRPAMVAPNGDFEFRNVPPGAYTLIAMVPERGGASLSARLPLEVTSASVEGVNVVMTPPLRVSGKLRAADQTPAAAAVNVTIGLRPRDPFAVGPPLNATAQPGGEFSFPAVPSDHYDVTFSGLPAGSYIKSVTAGGRNVLLAGLDLTRGLPGRIDVEIGSNAGQASGVVQNDRQEPVPGATVVLVPQEEERKSVAQYYRTSTADDAGAFTFDNLTPGTYKVYAWTEIEAGAYYDPDFMRPYENAGESVTIREGSREDLKVRLIG